MQCGTMSVKNHPGVLRSTLQDTPHNEYVRSLSLSKIIGRLVRVMLFCKNAPTMWDRHRLKGALKPGVFTPKAYTLKSPSGPLPHDSGPTPKTIFLHTDIAHELYNTHDLTLVFQTHLTHYTTI